MKSKKILAIWMDESIAYLMASVNEMTFTITIKSGYNLHRIKQKSIQGNLEVVLHTQSQVAEYFNKISKYIIDFERVIFFGPIGSKNELFNSLLLNSLFDHINMSIRDSGKMNYPKRESFVMTKIISSGHSLSAFRKRGSTNGSFESAEYSTTSVLN